MRSDGLDRILDVAVVGAGPAALCVLHEAKAKGLDAVAIDKGPVCGALLRHPTYMRWFSTADKLELAGFPLLCSEKNPTRQEYLQYCRAFATHHGLSVNAYREVTAVIPLDGLFRIEARDLYGRPYAWRAKSVVMGTGFYDSPRVLDIPGGDLPKVSHRFTEVHGYAGFDVLVIGAGSSAVEVALELYRAGACVTVLMRGEGFHTKYWLEPDIENRIREGAIACYRNAEVLEIRMDDVLLRSEGEAQVELPNDFVLAMTGYEPDTRLLEAAGAEVDPETRRPTLSESLESSVAGLYVAGTLIAGTASNTVFVENSREHAPRIVSAILAKRG